MVRSWYLNVAAGLLALVGLTALFVGSAGDSWAAPNMLANGGFATDVYAVEPPPVTALLAHDMVVATPHAGALTAESVERATRGAVENLVKVLGMRA